jgi:hypothetical protein
MTRERNSSRCGESPKERERDEFDTDPYAPAKLHEHRFYWCGWRGSNPRPLASEANTLSTELQPRWEEFLKRCEGYSFSAAPSMESVTSGAIPVPKQVFSVYNRGFGGCLHLLKQATLAGQLRKLY